MMKTISINEARQAGVKVTPPKVENEAKEIEVVKQAINELKTSLERAHLLSGQQVTTALAQVSYAINSFSTAVEQLDQTAALSALTAALSDKPAEVKEWTFTVTKRDDNDNIVSFKAVKG